MGGWGSRAQSNKSRKRERTSDSGWGSRRRQPVQEKKEEHKRGGITGFLGRGLSDLETMAIHSPAGVYHALSAGAHDLKGHPSALVNPAELISVLAQGETGRKVWAPMATQTAADFRHPLRHPGYTGLDILAIAGGIGGGAARLGAAGKALKAGEGAQAAAKAALKTPKPVPRNLKYAGEEVPSGYYSKNPTMRQAQKLLDQMHERFPESRAFGRSQPARVGKALSKQRRVQEAIARMPAAELESRGRKLSTAQQIAIRVVAEGKPISRRIAFHEKQLAEGGLKKRRRRETKRQIALLKAAERYVAEADGKLHLADPKLAEVYDLAKSVADERSKGLREANLLSAESEVSRVQAPGRVIEGRPAKQPAQLSLLDALDEGLLPELPDAGEFRVPYARRRAPRALANPKGYQGGKPRAPGSLTHSFEGQILASGGGRNDITRLVAESNIEAQRHLGLLRARDEFVRMAHDEKQGAHEIPIRLDSLKNRPLPPAVREIMDKADEGVRLTREEQQALGMSYEHLREDIFPEKIPDEPIPGIKFIDSRLLGGLNKPNPLIGLNAYKGGRATLATLDAINNASRLAILYLKPAYAIPNMLGNTALVIVQQGFAAPKNLAHALRMERKLGARTTAGIDAIMGEGIARSLAADAGAGRKIVSFAAGKWGAVIDVPFRRASFLHAAHKEGFRTPEQLRDLLTNDANAEKLGRVASEANGALIDYGNLSPMERAVIARVIFFYPWVKGSTVFAGRFLRDHPIQAAVAAKVGEMAKQRQAEDLGEVPSFAEGIFQVGERGGNPLVSNPTAASILQTPAQVEATIRGFATGNGKPSAELPNMLTPVLGALLAGATGRSPLGYDVPKGLPTVLRQLYEPLPQTQLYRRSRMSEEERRKKLYPMTAQDALYQFLFGTIAPRPVNKRILHQRAKEEK